MKILLFNLLPMIDSKGGAEKVFCNMANTGTVNSFAQISSDILAEV